jgi:hypothetical protein
MKLCVRSFGNCQKPKLVVDHPCDAENGRETVCATHHPDSIEWTDMTSRKDPEESTSVPSATPLQPRPQRCSPHPTACSTSVICDLASRLVVQSHPTPAWHAQLSSHNTQTHTHAQRMSMTRSCKGKVVPWYLILVEHVCATVVQAGE